MAHSPHRQWKGCRLCKSYKDRSNGPARRQSLATLRKVGKVRRLTRHDLGDAVDSGA